MTSTISTPSDADRSTLPPTPISFEDFLAWRDDVRAEWVAGEIVLMSPNSLDHQLLVGFLYRILAAYVENRRLGTLLVAPILMRIPTRPRGREPDLIFVSEEHSSRLRETYLDGAADLAIEVVSPESAARDRGDKFVEYEEAGIPEYWLIDALRREAVFNQLGSDGRYHPGPLDRDGIYRSSMLPGFWLQVDWLWQRPLPSVDEVTQRVMA